MNLKELAWAAGFFDGEGCTSAHVRNGRATGAHIAMSISQNDRDNLERFKSAVGGLGSIRYDESPSRPRGIHVWSVQNWRDVQAVVAFLWKYLNPAKKKQALKSIALYRSEPWGRPIGRPKGAKDMYPRKTA